MPPASRNQRPPTAGETPAEIAAASLDSPAAILAQNRTRSSRLATVGRPGDRSGLRPDRSGLRLRRIAIATASFAVLRRPVESAQYTSIVFGLRCKHAGVRPSMGSVGDAYDNAMAESIFASLECELLDRRVIRTQVEARMEDFRYYNPNRRHSAHGYLSPLRFEAEHGARVRPTLAPPTHSPHPSLAEGSALYSAAEPFDSPGRRWAGSHGSSVLTCPLKRGSSSSCVFGPLWRHRPLMCILPPAAELPPVSPRAFRHRRT